MPATTKLAQVLSREEGFGIPGVIPTIRHNPMDLRHSPHSQHPGGSAHANDIGTIDNDDDGWSDAERQLRIYANQEQGFTAYAPNGLTLAQMVNVICGLPANPAPNSVAPDNNNVAAYLRAVTLGMGMPSETMVSEALKVPATIGHKSDIVSGMNRFQISQGEHIPFSIIENNQVVAAKPISGVSVVSSDPAAVSAVVDGTPADGTHISGYFVGGSKLSSDVKLTSVITFDDRSSSTQTFVFENVAAIPQTSSLGLYLGQSVAPDFAPNSPRPMAGPGARRDAPPYADDRYPDTGSNTGRPAPEGHFGEVGGTRGYPAGTPNPGDRYPQTGLNPSNPNPNLTPETETVNPDGTVELAGDPRQGNTVVGTKRK